MIFECPPALQVWALSDIPSILGCFPCTSLYENFDFLFWRKNEVGFPTSQRDCFPWIIWFIWKARNNKAFNGKETWAIDTLLLARTEAESWEIARKKEEEEDQVVCETTPVVHPPQIPHIPTCQIDASWIDHGLVSGLGWFLRDNMGATTWGKKDATRAYQHFTQRWTDLFGYCIAYVI
ncbi:hypothetical protein N665_1125s0006 [Sinapis alba]|nr:hypothetical protein N665_1125s0006 [Sinapis alba]